MKHATYAILITAAVLTSGCAEIDMLIGYGEEMGCDMFDPGAFSEDWDRSHCYKDAAEKKNTPETCAKVEESAPKTKCYMELAEKLWKPELCDNLQDRPSGQDYSRLQCLQQAAVANGDTRICDRMGTAAYNGFVKTYSKENCIQEVKTTPPKYPDRSGFDPTDTDAASGGAF